jgi:hypothetical protein
MNIKYEYLSWGIFREGIVGDSVKMTGVATTCHLVAAGSSRLVGYERGCCCSCKRGGGGGGGVLLGVGGWGQENIVCITHSIPIYNSFDLSYLTFVKKI